MPENIPTPEQIMSFLSVFEEKAKNLSREIDNLMELISPGFKDRVKHAKKYGIKLPYLTYPDLTKPIWTEDAYDNETLYRWCKKDIEHAQFAIEAIEDCIDWRKNPKLRRRVKNLPQKLVTGALLGLWRAERYLIKFENENYIQKSTIEKHREQITRIREKLKQITIKESLRIDNGN